MKTALTIAAVFNFGLSIFESVMTVRARGLGDFASEARWRLREISSLVSVVLYLTIASRLG